MTFVRYFARHSFSLVTSAAIAALGIVFIGETMAQQWNEIPSPTGKEAVSRTYPVGYRTDLIDVSLRGNGAEIEYMIRMKTGWFIPGRRKASAIRNLS